jgi:chromosome segregation ATPase
VSFRTIRGMTLTPSRVLRMASPPQEDIIPDEADAPLFNHHRVPVRQALATECGYSQTSSEGRSKGSMSNADLLRILQKRATELQAEQKEVHAKVAPLQAELRKTEGTVRRFESQETAARAESKRKIEEAKNLRDYVNDLRAKNDDRDLIAALMPKLEANESEQGRAHRRIQECESHTKAFRTQLEQSRAELTAAEQRDAQLRTQRTKLRARITELSAAQTR